MSEKVFLSIYGTIIALLLFVVPVGRPNHGGYFNTHYCFITSMPKQYTWEIVATQWIVPLIFVAVAGAVIYYVKYMKK